MQRSPQMLTDDARRIWWAGVEAVQPRRLIPEQLSIAGQMLCLGPNVIDLREIERIVVVGAGKAGASMTVALEQTLGEQLLEEKHVTGWVNVPADCMQTTQRVKLHAARPEGINEPTKEGVVGTLKILEIVSSLGPTDLCICLLSGGGSALMPAPIQGISLNVKAELTREISARGGTIHQLNSVRRELSRIKGGGLARACRAGTLATLILSDVLGDDLETIASGPTVAREPTPELAVRALEELGLDDALAGRQAIVRLGRPQPEDSDELYPDRTVWNLLIGNNATAVDAAGLEAERLGYSHAMISANQPEGPAEKVARHLVGTAHSMRLQGEPDCLISGGEPTVQLAPPEIRGLGGRNGQLALAALAAEDDWSGLTLLSGGTDGEDGPTDAAGAVVDHQVVSSAQEQGLDSADYLRRNDSYHFFDQTGGLLKTGPTHTNVCDLRVITLENNAD